MAAERFGALGGAEKAATRFVLESLERSALRIDGPKTINIHAAFAAFLEGHGVDRLVAGELAEQQFALVRRKVVAQVERWRSQGVDSPMDLVLENEVMLVTWRHDRFEELTGFPQSQVDFIEVHEWIGDQKGSDFLIPCLAFLKSMSCDPIFITDGARDEGIDCIGLISRGALKSTVVFVQARSSSSLFDGDPLLQEYAKYASLPRTEKYMRYLDALGLGRLKDGAAFLYAVLINSDFKYSAQQNAARLGVLIRSRRQIAQVVSPIANVERLGDWKNRLAIPAKGDLTTNVSPLMV